MKDSVSGKGLGEFVRTVIEERGMGMAEAAERAGVSNGYLAGLLSGRAVIPNPVTLSKMSEGWGVPKVRFYIAAGLLDEEDLMNAGARRPGEPGGGGAPRGASATERRARVMLVLRGLLSLRRSELRVRDGAEQRQPVLWLFRGKQVGRPLGAVR